MTRQRLYRRLVRRETHSARTASAVVVAIAFGIATVRVGVESVLFGAGLPALLMSPVAMLTALARREHATSLVVVFAVVASLLGLTLLALGVMPGRRARRWRIDDRLAFVVDDRVVAAALSARAARSARVAPGMTRTAVARRRAIVRVTPVAGLGVDADAVHAVVARELDADALRPRLSPAIAVGPRAVVGA